MYIVCTYARIGVYAAVIRSVAPVAGYVNCYAATIASRICDPNLTV